ncbi:hypothetical protein ACKU27_23590 [Sphingobium yanoikuyae]|jgi:hypothetical protein|uniref:hypothetical protein n=1 Tax=Sphingobium yanoikuyae TaxID=13690 RepID=UPI003A5C2AC4
MPMILVEDEGHAAGHARAEIGAGLACLLADGGRGAVGKTFAGRDQSALCVTDAQEDAPAAHVGNPQPRLIVFGQ